MSQVQEKIRCLQRIIVTKLTDSKKMHVDQFLLSRRREIDQIEAVYMAKAKAHQDTSKLDKNFLEALGEIESMINSFLK